MKDGLWGRIMKEFITLNRKIYTGLTDDSYVDEKAESTIKCVINREIKFWDFKDCSENKKMIFRSQ